MNQHLAAVIIRIIEAGGARWGTLALTIAMAFMCMTVVGAAMMLPHSAAAISGLITSWFKAN